MHLMLLLDAREILIYMHYLRKIGDSRTFQPINVEGMFEGSSGWSGQDWPWRHMHPTSWEKNIQELRF